MKVSVTVLGLLLTAITAFSQQKHMSMPDWEFVRGDNAGRIYLAASNGDIVRYDPENQQDPLRYSPVKKAQLTLLDVNNGLRPFLFYEDLQEYVILDRFLTETSRYRLTPFTSYAGIVAPALNNQLWVVDMVDFSLLKTDPQLEQITIRVPLPQVLDPDDSDFNGLHEYQNILFLTDRHSGIYLFDNLGNFLRRIEVPGINYLHFRNNLLYYQRENEPGTLYTEDIYSGYTQQITLPAAARSVWLGPESMWLFQDQEVWKYALPESLK